MNNILNFPAATIVNKPVPKNAFWQRAERQNALKATLTDEFDTITWLYKLTAETLNVADGGEVHEIDVFHCRMKDDFYSVNPFCAMDRMLPRHTLFIVEYGASRDIIMHHKVKTDVRGETVWRCGVTEMKRDVDFSLAPLRIEGQTMDAVYYSLLAQVSHLPAQSQAEYEDKAELRQQLQKTEKQIASLQKRIRSERQLNRQMEMNAEARQLKLQAMELKTKIDQ